MDTKVMSEESAVSLYREVYLMRQAVEKLYRKVLKRIPATEGSELWWEKAELEAQEDINMGRTIRYNSVDELAASLKKKAN